ncbi:hypothetical protein PR003_g22522 [Phytophthora rubi]|uniref:Uncharacterized protein n=1 Tax=Phytophthora rubi TaxID=129364 RepID=A0A6A3J877_9STRA|nr:hypothetical protein PR002_g21975 [Phytophthora rubi]KAE9301429.1 hypothetical protein PR003_g22522 [Phytophthora rubi]
MRSQQSVPTAVVPQHQPGGLTRGPVSTRKADQRPRPKNNGRAGFAAFQRAEALGRYEALAEEDSDAEDAVDGNDAMSDIEISADDPELPTSVEDATRSDGVGTHQGGASPTFQPDTPSGMEVESKVEPAHTQTVALVQTTLATYIQSDGPRPSAQVPVETTASHESEETVPATPDSQQEFTMGRPHVGGEVGDEDLPIQAAHFLSSFDGCEVAVEGNGQCAMLAFYASISNHSTRTLKNTAATTTQVSEVKRGVYALMMANLRHDVELV